MKDSKLHQLKKETAKLSDQPDSKKKMATLSRAFELFSDETKRVEAAYNSLKDEFAIIHDELDKTNKRLIRKIGELDVLTAYLDNILRNIAQGIVFIDLNGDITTYNHAAGKMLGIEEKEAIGSPFWKNFADDAFGFSMREALATQNPPKTAFASAHSAGEERCEMEINTTFVSEQPKPTPYSKGLVLRKMQGIIVLIRDITDIRSLQHLANRNDRLKELGEMAAMVAHEIRNPLGGIKGFASLLRRDLTESPGHRQMAEYIVEGTDTLNRLVTNVLNYSRPIDLKLKSCDVVSLIEEVEAYIQADDRLKENIDFSLKIPLNPVHCRVDAPLLKSSLLNLVVNAIQAMPKGGKLTVGLEEREKEVQIEISDTGEGIAPENLEKIFSPFFTTKADGNGFGLAEVHKVIQAHDGTIEVRSKVDAGTTFTITLPKAGA